MNQEELLDIYLDIESGEYEDISPDARSMISNDECSSDAEKFDQHEPEPELEMEVSDVESDLDILLKTIQDQLSRDKQNKNDKRMKKREFDYYVGNNGFLAVKWRYSKSVHLLFNYHNPEYVEPLKERVKMTPKKIFLVRNF
ncbi:hypothetical protein ILUMI_19290 [Ignelater luminosus]|uniref:Uncharacterized protein n=1 Tax=Ignelater luminosus TaxID=2038154 RepID=A0A8K0CGG4_IGNLU|nr:hypothetical protein ILUMI_19290 [Ignelater luminosus]